MSDATREGGAVDGGREQGATENGRDPEEASDGRRAALGYALLFSVPVGVGIVGAVMRMSGRPALDPLVSGPALLATTVLFVFVLAAARGSTTGKLDSDRR